MWIDGPNGSVGDTCDGCNMPPISGALKLYSTPTAHVWLVESLRPARQVIPLQPMSPNLHA